MTPRRTSGSAVAPGSGCSERRGSLLHPRGRHVVDELLHRGRDAIEDGLRKDTERENQHDDRHENPTLLGRSVADRRVRALGASVKDALVGPEEVHGGGEDTRRGDLAPPGVGTKGANENEVLTNETPQPPQAEQ